MTFTDIFLAPFGKGHELLVKPRVEFSEILLAERHISCASQNLIMSLFHGKITQIGKLIHKLKLCKPLGGRGTLLFRILSLFSGGRRYGLVRFRVFSGPRNLIYVFHHGV